LKYVIEGKARRGNRVTAVLNLGGRALPPERDFYAFFTRKHVGTRGNMNGKWRR